MKKFIEAKGMVGGNILVDPKLVYYVYEHPIDKEIIIKWKEPCSMREEWAVVSGNWEEFIEKNFCRVVSNG